MLASLIQVGGRIVSEAMRNLPRHNYKPPDTNISLSDTSSAPATSSIPGDRTAETIEYQKREMAKELLLLEKHLQQGCKINGKACDCCKKHPIAIEGLAQETRGMTSEPVLEEIVTFVKDIGPKTTEEASASGIYDREYPNLAIKARQLRKAIMANSDTGAVLTKEEKNAIDKTDQESTAGS